MVAGRDQGFRFLGQLFPVGVAQQVSLAQGVQQGFTIFLVQVFRRKALPDRGPWRTHVVTLIKEQVFKGFPGQFKGKFKRLDQTAALKIGVARLVAGSAELGQGMAEVVQPLPPAHLVGIAHGAGRTPQASLPGLEAVSLARLPGFSQAPGDLGGPRSFAVAGWRWFLELACCRQTTQAPPPIPWPPIDDRCHTSPWGTIPPRDPRHSPNAHGRFSIRACRLDAARCCADHRLWVGWLPVG